jgi:hypothetical protein
MEKLTPQQWTERTIRDIKRRQERREKGIKDAEQYGYDARLKSSKRMSKIRCKSYRGK